ncbi:MAG TPA: dihydropteroate synthase [Bacteroidales bacterium]|nr:dihydropteroate synthase [Bacteroidales bacterium]
MFVFNLQGKAVTFNEPAVMAIINSTPDSFYASSRLSEESQFLSRAVCALEQGAAILDIGGCSSRPDAADVPEEEEWQRLQKALACIRREFPQAILSVDTFRASVARRAVEEYGVQIINDISGGELDMDMFRTVADVHAAYVLMHMQGTPKTMQSLARYDNLFSEMVHYFEQRINRLHALGVSDIILDPGFGFAKTVEQNYELLRKMSSLRLFELPLLAGLSRKSMIYKPLGCTPAEALNGTTALNMLALEQGAAFLRVHDVQPAMEAIRLYQLYKGQQKD